MEATKRAPLPAELKQRAYEIYERKLKPLEKTNEGEVLALDIDTEEWKIGPNTPETWKRLTEAFQTRAYVMFFVVGSQHRGWRL